MNEADLKVRTKQFAQDIIRLCRALPDTREGKLIGNQIFRSGTSVGANYRAACRAKTMVNYLSHCFADDDDEPSIVRIGKRMLQGLGYRVEARTEGLEALEVFAADPAAFDLVLTDMDKPQMIGEELTQRLLAIRPDLPVILCTGFSERITKENLQEKGTRAMLMKPFQWGSLEG